MGWTSRRGRTEMRTGRGASRRTLAWMGRSSREYTGWSGRSWTCAAPPTPSVARAASGTMGAMPAESNAPDPSTTTGHPAPDRLWAMVYDQLRAAAQKQMNDERASHTLSATALVHEAYLKLAARNYGEPAGTACPVCEGPGLRRVHYVYGDKLGTVAGQAKHPVELQALAQRVAEFRVYLVEVCNDCGWNHLIRTFVLGLDKTAPPMPNAADG